MLSTRGLRRIVDSAGWIRAVLSGGTLAAAVVFAAVVGNRLRERGTEQRVADLRRSAATDREAVVRADDLSGLPDPVRRYLDNALSEGQPLIDAARIEQEGRLRVGDAASPWKSFTATHHVTVEPPGFCWDARVQFAPLISVSVRDLYRDGEGSASVSLFGLLPIDSAEPSSELAEAELMRYLAEAVWYPTALLPREGVEWDPVDDESARATIESDGVSATLTFTFEDDEVRRVHADARYRRVDGGYEPTPWTGYWDSYETRHGMRAPTEGAVVWHLPDEDLRAWEGHVANSEYDA